MLGRKRTANRARSDRSGGQVPTCEVVRQAISAALDGEELPPETDEADLDLHLAWCNPCRRFEAGSQSLHRRLRVRLAEPVPDLSESILASLADPSLSRSEIPALSDRRPGRSPRTTRLTRLAAACVPLGLAVSGLASGTFSNYSIVPSHPVTPCIVGLLHEHPGFDDLRPR
jgi:predicted anti-sigma-YlaC factor YlaD